MVKAELDVTIDYYSLLDVSLRADPEEIKKQYRKLGTYLRVFTSH
jgi:DnaJ-domain-containing protein 1